MRILGAATEWLRRIVDIALIALIVTVLVALALGKLVPLTGRQTVIIGGSSMEPAIHLGSAVVLTPVDPAGLAVGDVVSMRVPDANATFTHRIQAIVDRADGRWVQTKGDANPEDDPTLVPATAIIGRVDLAVPLMGYLIALLSLPIGVIFVLGLAATMLAVAWLLESLEPAGRRAATARRASIPAGSGSDGGSRPDGVVALGEPIAGGSSGSGSADPLVPPAPVLLPRIGAMAAQLAAPGTRTPLLAGPSRLPRPTAREQIARSREVRNQRARWGFRNRKPRSPD